MFIEELLIEAFILTRKLGAFIKQGGTVKAMKILKDFFSQFSGAINIFNTQLVRLKTIFLI